MVEPELAWTVSAQKTKALLSNVLEYAVTNDVLTDNAMRRVRAVKAKAPKPENATTPAP
jgi:hypothetical protein